MDRSPPPFFKQGPSANARLAFFALLAIALLVVDARVRALDALRQGIGTVLYPLQRTLLVPRDVFTLGGDYFTEVARLRDENAELRRLETANARTLLQAEQLMHENRQLRELLAARERTTVRSVVAEVLYETRDPFSRRAVLDKGLQHGVVLGQPVIDARGVVGQVTRVFPLSAEVTQLTDPNMTVPVQVQRTGHRAIAFGSATAVDRMELRFTSVNTDLKEGDQLLTSGLDSIYPAGMPVGRVSLVERGRTGNFARVVIEPVTGLDRSRMVLVLLVDHTGMPAMLPPEATEAGRRRMRRE
jgi:rod shape-determining protein MreC